MARPKNAAKSVVVRIAVLPVIRDWLDQLATYGVYGNNSAEVAEHFVRAGVEAQLRGDGLIRQPPPGLKKE